MEVNGETVPFYKGGEDQTSSGFQKGDEIREKTPIQAFPAFSKE